MGKSALNAKRSNMFMIEPERLTLVSDKNHPLYDPRVENEPEESMIANVAMNGVLNDIHVRKNGEAIEVIAGRGRTKSALEVNRRRLAEGTVPMLVPVVVKGGTDADMFGIMISENEIRRDDTMLIKGNKARKLLNMGYTVQEIAVTFGVSYQTVNNWLEAEELPLPIKDAVEAGEMTASAAIQLSKHTREEQVQRFENMKQQGTKMTVENVKSAAVSANNQPAPKMKSRAKIEEVLSIYADVNKDDDPITFNYCLGYSDALRWVLGR